LAAKTLTLPAKTRKYVHRVETRARFAAASGRAWMDETAQIRFRPVMQQRVGFDPLAYTDAAPAGSSRGGVRTHR
jgi:hypothetical protein